MSAGWSKGVVPRQSSQEVQPPSRESASHPPSPSAAVRATSIRQTSDRSLAEAADHVSAASTAVLNPQPLTRSSSLHHVSQIPPEETRPLSGAVRRMTDPHSPPPTPQDRNLVTATLNGKVDPAAPKREKQYSTMKKVILVACLAICVIGSIAAFGSGIGAIGGGILLGTALLIGFIYRDELKEIGLDIKDKLASIFPKKAKPPITPQLVQPASTPGGTSPSRPSLSSGVAPSAQSVSVEDQKEHLEIQLVELESKKTVHQSEHQALRKEFSEIDDKIIELDTQAKQIAGLISQLSDKDGPDRKTELLAQKNQLEEEIAALTEEGQQIGLQIYEHEKRVNSLEDEILALNHHLVSLMPPPPIDAAFLGASPIVPAREPVVLDRSKRNDISTPEQAVDLPDVPHDSFDARAKGSYFTPEAIQFHQTQLRRVQDELERADREIFEINGRKSEKEKLLRTMSESSKEEIVQLQSEIVLLEKELVNALEDYEYAKGVLFRLENDETGLYLKEVAAEKARQLSRTSFTDEEVEQHQQEMESLKAVSRDLNMTAEKMTKQLETKKKELGTAQEEYQSNPKSSTVTWSQITSLKTEVSSLESRRNEMKQQADAYDQLQKDGAASLIGQFSAKMEAEEASTRHLASMSSSGSDDSISDDGFSIDELHSPRSVSASTHQPLRIGDLVSEQGKVQMRFEKSLSKMRDLKDALDKNGKLLTQANQAKNECGKEKAIKQQAGEDITTLEVEFMELQKKETELKKHREVLVNEFMAVAKSHAKWMRKNPSKVEEILSAQNLDSKDAAKRAVRKDRLEKISNFVTQFSQEFEKVQPILRFSTQTIAELKSIASTLRTSLAVTGRKDRDTVAQITEYLYFRRLEIMSKIDVSKMLSNDYRASLLRDDIVLVDQISLELAGDKKHAGFEKWMKIAENLYQMGNLHDANLIYISLQTRKAQIEGKKESIGHLETVFGELKKHYDTFLASDKQPRPGIIIPLSEIFKKLIQPSEKFEEYNKQLNSLSETDHEAIENTQNQLIALVEAQANLLQNYFSGHDSLRAPSNPVPTTIENNLLLARARMETF